MLSRRRVALAAAVVVVAVVVATVVVAVGVAREDGLQHALDQAAHHHVVLRRPQHSHERLQHHHQRLPRRRAAAAETRGETQCVQERVAEEVAHADGASGVRRPAHTTEHGRELLHPVRGPAAGGRKPQLLLEAASHQHVELVEPQPIDASPLARHRRPKRNRKGPGAAFRHRMHQYTQPLRQLRLHLGLVRVPEAVEERLPDLAQPEVVDLTRTAQILRERGDGLLTYLLICEHPRARHQAAVGVSAVGGLCAALRLCGVGCHVAHTHHWTRAPGRILAADQQAPTPRLGEVRPPATLPPHHRAVPSSCPSSARALGAPQGHVDRSSGYIPYLPW